MDLNDPRRRLQVARNNNPSLRMAVAPKQKLSVSMAQPQQLSIAQPSQPRLSNAGQVQQQIPVVGAEPTQETQLDPYLKTIADFTQGANEQFLGGLIKSPVTLANLVASGFDQKEAERRTNEFLDSIGQTNREGIFNSGLVGTDRSSGAFKAGEVVGQGEKLATDLATAIIPGAAAEKAITKGLQAKNILQGSGFLPGFGRNAISGVGGGAVSSGVIQAQDPTQNAGENFGTGLALDTAASAIGPVGSAVSRGLGIANKLSGLKESVTKLFKSSDGGIVKDIAAAKDAGTIQKALNVPDDVASYLASETDPETVKQVLKELSVDPSLNIPDEVRERLQKEGISAVNKEDTEYGIEYDPNDASINVRDQSFATEDNLYHELGHHIYTTKLTPEERALFADVKGAASKQAVGREGYSNDDIISEDFSDMLRRAMRGEVDDIPEALRPVLQKYAGIAKQEADAAGIPLPTAPAPQKAGIEVPEAPIPQSIDNLVNELDKLSQERMGIDNALDPRSQEIAQRIDEIQAEIAQTPPTATQQVAQEADEVGQAQTGVSEATPAASNDAALGVQSADEVLPPDADEATKKAVQDVIDSLNSAERSYDDVTKVRAKEKGTRIGIGGENYSNAGGGEAGFQAKLGALKGRYSESGFEPIQATPEMQATLLDDIERSGLRDFEKLNTQNALRKIWGANPDKPTPADIKYLRKYFGDEMADSVEDAIEAGGKDWREWMVDIAGLPRAAMASFDFSMGLRQGGQVAASHFPTWFRANKESAKYAAKPGYFDEQMKNIINDDAYETITDVMGIRLPAAEGMSDEVMASAHLLEKIPVYGKGIAASDRAYSGGLTKLRYDLGKQWLDAMGGVDEALKTFSKKELQDMGEVINTSTGSGGKKGGFTEKHMQTLATTLFAPRLWASRLNSINPVYYARLSGPAREEAVKNMASFLGVAASVVGLAKMAGAEVEGDPRSSDFMKIKVGNTRYDVMGGLQQNIVFAARMATGEKKNSADGEIETLADGFTTPDRVDLGVDMLTNKLNPMLGYLARLLRSSDDTESDNPLERQDRFGEDMNVAAETGKLATPLGVQGLVDTVNDTGDAGKSVAMNIPSFFGIGVQTYGGDKTKDNETASTGDRVKDAQAKAEQLRADRKEARETAISKLSEDDRVIYELGKADKDALTDKEAEKYERVKQWVDDFGQEAEVPEGVTSDIATSFYKKYNSMVKEDQENWLKQKPDDNSKAIAKHLNAQRSKGLDEFKPSNQLAKLYADFEKDMQSKDYSDLDKAKREKKLQKDAYKLNFNDNAREYYSTASNGINSLRAAIDAGKVKKEDLDAAIKLDNDLYTSGLNGSLQFSRKFRTEYGYGVPSGTGGKGGIRFASRSGGGSGGSQRAQLSALIPSSKGAKASPAPKFSAKRRTAGISFKSVNAPKKSSSKKVTINL